MRAIRVHRFGGPEVLQLDETPDPPLPSSGQVLVRIEAAGVNPVEAYLRSGQYSELPPLPYTPGSDAGGVVVAVGDGVDELVEGQRVYTSGSLTGTYAATAVAPATQVHPLPDGVSFAQGAALGVPYATAYRALLQRGGARRGELVLVHGASGGVGLAAVQLAAAAGIAVHGTAGSPEGRRLVAGQGAAEVVDHGEPGHEARLAELTGGRGYDLIVELLANVNLGVDLGLLAKDGRVVVVGSRGPVEIRPRELMNREADIRGMRLPNVPPAELAAIHAALFSGLKRGDLRPVIARELPLEQAGEAHRLLAAGHVNGKIVLVP